MSLERVKIIGYIVDMSLQMNIMANNVNSPFLAYLLEMVAKEGQHIMKNDAVNKENR
ncbi:MULTISPECIES: hypothetical protein [Bartonella]|uniref:Uncharacterized protein n=1 Tax=Bartonella apis TaxID=1686310 RepID=A0A1R0F6Z0_9HYPH|nr:MULTISPECIES: hypothetical protein [Bartonella]MBH9988523.1 hypothetical protein [Bartonella apis]MBI0172546.1 hypothetical protein [Bartonella sp. W8151]MCT6823518.1 hypothetical protein [Bartonella apis]MCT6859971.1 hypothetical protein [Bartonella apis]MCT6887703.1 hypothetical protein [Bartonella apis]